MSELAVAARGADLERLVSDESGLEPVERAQARLKALGSSFASVLSIVAAMHRDEDWRLLTREDGTSYSSLAEVVTDALGVSISMARRYVQGARDFFQPLEAIVVDGTPIQITSGDVAALGQGGLKEVIAVAAEQLDGVTDPDESAAIITGAVDQVKERKAAEKAAAASGGDDGWADEGWADTDDDGGGRSSGPVPGMQFSSGPDASDGDDGWADDMDGLPMDDVAPPRESPPPAPAHVHRADPVAKILDGAPDYARDPDALADLPAALQQLTKTLLTLRNVDADSAGAMVGEDERGVLGLTIDAMSTMARLRTSIETSPWFIDALGRSE